MSLITENEIRKKLKDKELTDIKEFEVLKGCIITPSAKSYLTEHNISLKYVNSLSDSMENKNINNEANNSNFKYETVFGVNLNEKPEYMTHLYGNLLVFKDHKRIVLRGRLDSLEAKILEVQILAHKLNIHKLVDALQEVLDFVGNLVRCEVLEEPVKEFFLQGMNAAELREKSHHPQKYFGIGHEMPTYKMGEVVVALNSIRTQIRETELLAYKAFKDEYGAVSRNDIIKALNRLSSLLWIMIFKFRTGEYN